MSSLLGSKKSGLSRFLYDPAQRNALVTSVSFFLIFTAFGVAQNFATSVHASVGSISLGILYGVLTFSNIFVPKFMSYITPKQAMFWGSVTYALFVISNIYLIVPVLYTTSAIEGVGAALLWVAQGAFITKCSNEYEKENNYQLNSQLGYFNGIFWMWFQGNQFIGNLLAALLFQFSLSNRLVYCVLSVINVIGCLCFLFLRKWPNDYGSNKYIKKNNKKQIQNENDINENNINENNINEGFKPTKRKSLNENKNKNKNNISSSIDNDNISESTFNDTLTNIQTVNILDAIKLWKDNKLQLLIIITIYSGVSQEFEFGEYPVMIHAKSHKFYCMSVFGLTDAIMSLWFGKISDKVGRFPILLLACICHGFVYLYIFFYKIKQDEIYLFIIVAIFLGVGDAGFNTQIMALYPTLLGEKAETFANFKFFQSLAMTWGFLWHSFVSRNVKVVTAFGVLICGALPIFLSPIVRSAMTVNQHYTQQLDQNDNDEFNVQVNDD